MTWTGVRIYVNGFGRRVGDNALRMYDKAQDAVGTEVSGKDIFSIRREDSAMYVGCCLSFSVRYCLQKAYRQALMNRSFSAGR